MKYLVFIAIYLLDSTGWCCNQRMYDMVYKAIIEDALKKNSNAPETFRCRNDAIEALRSLCEGQLSSYERGKNVENPQ